MYYVLHPIVFQVVVGPTFELKIPTSLTQESKDQKLKCNPISPDAMDKEYKAVFMTTCASHPPCVVDNLSSERYQGVTIFANIPSAFNDKRSLHL